MLLINTQKGQKIRVGPFGILTLESIDLRENRVVVSYDEPEKDSTDFEIGVGQSIDLTKNVMLTVTWINKDLGIVSLGFIAPRSIRIRGEWFGKKRNERGPEYYCNLTTEELLSVVRVAENPTLIESELAARLEQAVDVIARIKI